MALGVKKIFQHHDYQSLHELRNFIIHLVAGDPGSPVTGQPWYDTVANRFKVRVSGATKTLAHTDEISAGMTFDTPGSSAVGDTVAAGSDTDAARADHRHGREAFAAPTALTAFGVSTGTGTATTVPHSDHVHGSPAHDASAHSAIKLSDLAAPTAQLNIGGQKLTNGADATADTDFATLGQMNTLFAGLKWKSPDAVVKTQSNITLSGAQSHNGVSIVADDTVVVAAQTAGAENGLYLAKAGAWVRSPNADTAAELQGAAITVKGGTVDADTAWYVSTDAITLGTTAVTWAPFPGGGAITVTAPITRTANALSFTAGYGLTNAGAIDKTLVPIYKTALIGGAGPATSYTITNPGFAANRRIMVEIIEEATGETVEVGIGRASSGDVTVDFAAASVAGTDYRYMMTGLAA